MKETFKRFCRVALLVATTCVATAAVDFEAVRPLLADRCYKCHGPEKQKGGLRLDSKESALKGGDSNEPAVVPGDSAKSRLIKLVSSKDPDQRMPTKGEPLGAAQIDLLRSWIDGGAVWPNDTNAVAATMTELVITEEDRKHWSFRPLGTVAVPKVKANGWARGSIDSLILHRLEERAIRPNPEADRRTLIQRVYFDLIGLPPTPAEIEAFVKNSSKNAYEELVDRLLADARFGERWGRHWLDAVRFADSAGFEEDRPRPNAFHFRDFVIRAFNNDLPYDTFLQRQIAGDLLAPNDADVFAATGFITAAPDVRPDFTNFRKKDRYDELDDVVSTMGSSMLGLTLGCARCHDHKYDPLPTRDYYRLSSFFNSVERAEDPLRAEEQAPYNRELKAFEEKHHPARDGLKRWVETRKLPLRLAKIDALPASDDEKALLRTDRDEKNPKQKELLERYKKEIAVEDDELKAKLSPEELKDWERLKAEIKTIEQTKPKDIARVLSVRQGAPKKSYFLPRGNSDIEDETVTAGVLRVLSPVQQASVATPTNELTRVDLARWLTDPEHGAGALAARVMANRLWQHHFGLGLVETPGDFGVRGAAPTHPELLDWMASELIRGGWRLKPLHKLILMSATYRQGVAWDDTRAQVDPENHLWWHRRPTRLEAEALRDRMLFVSGSLNTKMFGPPVKPPIPPDAIASVADNYDRWPTDAKDAPETWRRGIYVFAKRSNLFPFLQAFDAPNTIGSCSKRNQTTVTPQALTLLNDAFVRNQMRLFARRVVWEAPGGVPERVTHAWKLAFGRAPTPAEVEKASRFIQEQTRLHESNATEPLAASAWAGLEAMTDFCQALVASNEFSYID